MVSVIVAAAVAVIAFAAGWLLALVFGRRKAEPPAPAPDVRAHARRALAVLGAAVNCGRITKHDLLQIEDALMEIAGKAR